MLLVFGEMFENVLNVLGFNILQLIDDRNHRQTNVKKSIFLSF